MRRAASRLLAQASACSQLAHQATCSLQTGAPALGLPSYNACSTSYSSALLPRLVRGIQGFARIAEHEKGQTKFHGYFAGGFVINNIQVPGSVIAQSDLYLLWKPRTMAEVTRESLIFLDLITPAPEVLVLGCGSTAQPLPKDVAQYLSSKGIKVEVLDSRNAPGYFNVLNEEGRVVVGAMLALDPTIPLAEVMPQQKEPIYDRPFLK